MPGHVSENVSALIRGPPSSACVVSPMPFASIPNCERYPREQRRMPRRPGRQGAPVTERCQICRAGAQRHDAVTRVRAMPWRMRRHGCFIFDVCLRRARGARTDRVGDALQTRAAWHRVMAGVTSRHEVFRSARERIAYGARDRRRQRKWRDFSVVIGDVRIRGMRRRRSEGVCRSVTSMVCQGDLQDPKKKRPPCSSQDGRPLFARRYQAGTPDSSPRNP